MRSNSRPLSPIRTPELRTLSSSTSSAVLRCGARQPTFVTGCGRRKVNSAIRYRSAVRRRRFPGPVLPGGRPVLARVCSSVTSSTGGRGDRPTVRRACTAARPIGSWNRVPVRQRAWVRHRSADARITSMRRRRRPFAISFDALRPSTRRVPGNHGKRMDMMKAV